MTDLPCIPQDVLDRGYRKPVHVEGWNKACRFFYVSTENGVHTLRTQKKKVYQTSNRLYATKRNA